MTQAHIKFVALVLGLGVIVGVAWLVLGGAVGTDGVDGTDSGLSRDHGQEGAVERDPDLRLPGTRTLGNLASAADHSREDSESAETALRQVLAPKRTQLVIQTRGINASRLDENFEGIRLSIGPLFSAPTAEAGVADYRIPRVEETVVEVVLDERGECKLAYPWGDSWEVMQSWGVDVHVEALEPSFWEVTKARLKPRKVDGQWLVHLGLELSPSVSGRVMDTYGEPVACHLMLYSYRAPGNWWREKGAMSNTDGEFQIAVPRGGNHVLLASSVGRDSLGEGELDLTSMLNHGFGSGVSSVFEVDFRTPTAGLEIVVSGWGILRGRVVGPDGKPIAGLEVLAVRSDVDSPGYWALNFLGGGMLYPLATPETVTGGGVLGAQVTTDHEGRFSIQGLRMGHFAVRVQPTQNMTFSVLLTTSPVLSDGTPFEVEFRRPTIVVHLVDINGQPLPKDWLALEQQKKSSPFPALREYGYGNNALTVVKLQADSEPSRVSYFRPKKGDEVTYTFLPEEGESYRIALRGVDGHDVVVDVPMGAGLIDVDLVVPVEVAD